MKPCICIGLNFGLLIRQNQFNFIRIFWKSWGKWCKPKIYLYHHGELIYSYDHCSEPLHNHHDGCPVCDM